MQEITIGSLFEKYKLQENNYDELFYSQKDIHPFCYNFLEEIGKIPQDVFKNLQVSTNNFFYDYGVHNPQEQSENVIPMDCIPRIMSYPDWGFVQKGLEQRIIAINLFLKDIYNKAYILKDKIISKEIIYNSVNFYDKMKGLPVSKDTYISVYNANVVRTKDGFFVLEDGVRASLGSSYMIACRQAMLKSFFSIIRKCNVLPVESYYLNLLKNFYDLSKKGEESTAVLLVSNEVNFSYFEYVFLAYQMGLDFVHSQDLLVQDNTVFIKTTKGLKKVDIIYNLLDDIFDPSIFKSESFLGVSGLFEAYQSGQVSVFNTPGVGIVEDKMVYTYIPKIIKYYLKQEPILHNIDSYFCRKKNRYGIYIR